MDLLAELRKACSERPRKIVLPEGEDPRILEAAARVQRERLANPIVIGNLERVRSNAGNLPEGITFVDPWEDSRIDTYVEEYFAMRGKHVVDRKIVLRVLSKCLHFGSMMVRMGDADGVVAGARNLTSSVIKAGKLFIGLRNGITSPSSFFIMDVPGHGQLVFADCAVNPDPGPELLAQIAVSSASSAREILGTEPRVAMLSFSTRGSADHPSVRKVAKATEIARGIDPTLLIDGEMQADTALVPEIAERKRAADVLGGMANVLVFPDLDSGNIAYKLVQHLAGAKAYGPFMQGFNSPINDLSRGCSVDEIVGAILVTSVQAGRSR